MRVASSLRVITAVLLAGFMVPSSPGAAQPAGGGLSVTATPSTGLVDGQIVEVTGSGFEPDTYELFECRADAVDISGCDADNADFAGTESDGLVHGSWPIDARIFDESGRELDCRSIPYGCKIGIGFLLDFDQSAFALLDFDPSAPLLPVPTVTVEPDAGLQDQQTVTVHGANLSSLFESFVYQCAADRPRSGETCNFDQDVRAVADEDGDVAVRYRVAATLQPALGGEPVDCTAAPGACVIEISQGFSAAPDRFARAPISFAPPAEPSPTTPPPATPPPATPPLAPPATPIPGTPTFTG